MDTNIIGQDPTTITSASSLYTALDLEGNQFTANATGYSVSVMPCAGTLKNFYIKCDAGPGAGVTRTFTIYKNGSDTGLTISLTGSGTGAGISSGNDTNQAHNVSFVAGDLLSIHTSASGTTTGTGVTRWTIAANCAANTSMLLSGGGAIGTVFPRYISPQTADTGTSAGFVESVMPTAGTLKNAYVKLAANVAASATLIFTLYQNGNPTSIVATVTAGNSTTNDTTHSVTVAAGDRLYWAVTATGSPGSHTPAISLEFDPTVNGESVRMSGGNLTQNTTTHEYQQLGQSNLNYSTTEANKNILTQAATWKKLYVYEQTSIAAGSYQYQLAVNGTAGNPSVTISSGQTGSDTVNTINTNAGDTVSMSITPASSPTGSIPEWGIVSFITPVSAGSPPPLRLPNKFVGPMALRNNFRQPLQPTGGGHTPTVYTQSLAGSLELAGSINKTSLLKDSNFAGTINLSGNLSKVTSRALSGTLNLAGSLSRQIQRILTGTLNLAGSLSRLISRTLTGSLNLAGNLNRLITRTLPAASLNLAGSLTKTTQRNLNGTINLAGSLVKQIQRSLSGSIELAGSLSKTIYRTLSGSLNLTGNLTKLLKRTLSGTLNLAGSLSSTVIFLVSLGGTLNLSGALTKQPQKALSGTINLTGSLSKTIYRKITGSLMLAGSLVKQVNRSLSGTFNLSGALSTLRQHVRSFTASLSLSGNLAKQSQRTLSGNLNLAGNLSRQINRSLAGSLNIAGSLIKTTIRTLAGGTLNLSGNLTKQVSKVFGGSINLTGSISRAIYRTVTASLNLTGNLSKQIARTFTGQLGLSGLLSTIHTVAKKIITNPLFLRQNPDNINLKQNPDKVSLDQDDNEIHLK
jgi:hypothetical protein